MKKIFERPIQMSSINRERSGISGPDDFCYKIHSSTSTSRRYVS